MEYEGEAIERFLDAKCTLDDWDGKTWREYLAEKLKTVELDSTAIVAGALATHIDPQIVSSWSERDPRIPHSFDWTMMERAFEAVVRQLCGLRGKR